MQHDSYFEHNVLALANLLVILFIFIIENEEESVLNEFNIGHLSSYYESFNEG